MNMRTVAEEYRLSYWAGVVREREESGLSIKAYCENAGFHENRYFYWQKKLREAAYELAGNGNKTTDLSTPVFAEVKLPTQQVLPMSGGAGQSQICIEVAGVRITAGDGYPADKLASLLTTVMQPC